MAGGYRLDVHSEAHRGEWCGDHYRRVLSYTVAATGPTGRRFLYAGPLHLGGPADCEALIRRIEAWARDHPFDPVRRVHWIPAPPAPAPEPRP